MTDTPQVLLAHHLKTLKLPTFSQRRSNHYWRLALGLGPKDSPASHDKFSYRLNQSQKRRKSPKIPA